MDEQWLAMVQESRIIILPGEESYLNLTGEPVKVETVVDQIGRGIPRDAVRAMYPGLTVKDITHCFMFVYLRIKHKI